MADRAATPHAQPPDATTPGQGVDDHWFDLDRTIAFSDAVIAVAITLLVVTLDVPNVSNQDLGNALEDLEPTIIAFVASFWLIAGFWIQHHQFSRRLKAIDGGLMRINLFFLFTISLTSLGTALFGAYASNPLAVTVYTVILVAVGFSLYRLWHYAEGHGLLVAGTAPPDEDPQVVAVRTLIFLSAIPLSLLTPWAPLIWLLNTRVSLIARPLRRLRRG